MAFPSRSALVQARARAEPCFIWDLNNVSATPQVLQVRSFCEYCRRIFVTPERISRINTTGIPLCGGSKASSACALRSIANTSLDVLVVKAGRDLYRQYGVHSREALDAIQIKLFSFKSIPKGARKYDLDTLAMLLDHGGRGTDTLVQFRIFSLLGKS